MAFEPPQAIRAVLARGRILVVPSLAESLPYVVLEAAAAAQPLVATRVGGIPEIFGQAAGDLVPARDPEALAAGIRRVLDDAPEVCATRVRALSDSIRQRFSLERMGSEVDRRLRRGLPGRNARRTAAPRTDRRGADAPERRHVTVSRGAGRCGDEMRRGSLALNSSDNAPCRRCG